LVDYSRTADSGLLDRAVDISNDAAQNAILTNVQSEEMAAAWSLGGAARVHRSRLSGHPHDLDDAIIWCRQALDGAPGDDFNRPAYASNLATILAERYDRDKKRTDLDEALTLFEWAVPAIRATGHHAAVALHNQGQALLELYSVDHDFAVLGRSIDVLQEALADPGQPRVVAGGYLTTLGQALRARAEVASDPSALDEAVEILHRAEDWTVGSDDHVAALVTLGNVLLDRSEIGRGVRDLEDSVRYLQQALALVIPATPQWGHLASNLANGLVAEFRATGKRASLRRARELFQDAASTFTSSADRDVCLSNLAACLQELYEQTGELSYLDEAIEVFRATVGGSATAISAERLQNFGVSLLARFKRYQSPEDLDQAISQFAAAARASPPDSVSHAAATNSLGNALFLRFDVFGRDADMDAAISAHQEAVGSARENSIDRAMYQANLGVTLMNRGQRTGSAADLEAAIHAQETAAADIPQASHEYIRVLAGLADSLAARAALTGSGTDIERAQTAYRSATAAGLERLPEQAIGSADSWGAWATARQSFTEAAEAFTYGLEALERLFATQRTRLHKETWLRDTQGISLQAAYALAMTADLPGASQAFERGRALLMSEALQRDQANVERLAEAGHADLRDQYEAAVSRWNYLSRPADDAAVPGLEGPGTGRRGMAVRTEDLREARG